MEIWKDIKGYESLYQVSNYGRVKRLGKTVERSYHGNIQYKEKILKIKTTNTYHQIGLTKNKTRKHYLLHRIVCIAFIPNPNNKPEVNHINGLKNDNRVENLEWVNASENIKHAFKSGLKSQKGQKNNASKLNNKQVYDIKYIKKNFDQRDLAKEYNVSVSLINYIINNKIWKHI